MCLLLRGVVAKIWNTTLIEMCHWATGIESVKCLAPGQFQLFTDFVGKMKFESKVQCSVSFSHSFSLGHRNTRIHFLFPPQNTPFQVDSYLSLELTLKNTDPGASTGNMRNWCNSQQPGTLSPGTARSAAARTCYVYQIYSMYFLNLY